VLLGLLIALVSTAALAGCGADAETPPGADPELVHATEVPETGVCRNLTREHFDDPTNASEQVDCEEPHNAETYASGVLPDDLREVDYLDPELDAWAYSTCGKRLGEHLSADESTLMRSMLTWTWFRPSEKAWEEGARWYRCDVVGGGPQSTTFLDLPASSAGLLRSDPGEQVDDRWMACARGDDFASARRVPCTQQHHWRAVTTIKLGAGDADYPGDRAVEVTTRDYCSDSVKAWLRYPGEFDFGYTWFGEDEWDAGNRRSVCWARTAE